MIVSLLNGGLAFAGKSGRNTANACDTNAIETNAIAAAHFMSRGLIKLRKRDKKILACCDSASLSGRSHFPVSDFVFQTIFPRRCHSLLIVRETRRAVWLKGCSTAQIVPLRSVRLNRNTAFRFGSIW